MALTNLQGVLRVLSQTIEDLRAGTLEPEAAKAIAACARVATMALKEKQAARPHGRPAGTKNVAALSDDELHGRIARLRAQSQEAARGPTQH